MNKILALSLAVVILHMNQVNAHAVGLMRTLWACSIPCSSSGSGEYLSTHQVTYCSTSTLSLQMLGKLDSFCKSTTGVPDAVASRAVASQVASCISSANICPTEGLVNSGYSCSFMCPAEDSVIHKFTACANSGDAAWKFATQICASAQKPNFIPDVKLCTAEGQTPCD